MCGVLETSVLLLFKNFAQSRVWWYMLVDPSTWRQRQADLHGVEVSRVYLESSRPARGNLVRPPPP